MKHRSNKAILNQPADRRKALMRNLLTSFFEHGSIQTTEAKAKALSREAEKLVTSLKKQSSDMNRIRILKSIIFTLPASQKALSYAGTTTKTSGFTRITRIKYRGDNALVVQIDLI